MSSETTAVRRVRVAVPVPLLEPLTYSLPGDFADAAPGTRVLVPLGNRVLTGVVTDVVAADVTADDPEALKPVIELLDETAFLPRDVLRVALWVAEYYACGAGEAVAAAMPPRAWVESERYARITEAGEARLLLEKGLRREVLEALSGSGAVRVDSLRSRVRGLHGAVLGLVRDGLIEITRPLKGRASAFRTVRVARITAHGLDAGQAAPGGATPKLGPRQREALALLAGHPDGIETSEMDARGFSAATIKRLTDLGLTAIDRRRVERDPFGVAVPPAEARQSVELTAEQTAAFARMDALSSAGGFRTVLLHGVTGSGKTELYLRLARAVRDRGRGVLVLVPEIALTPAIAAAFRTSFGGRVAIQHSALSDGERHDQWQRIRRGDVDVVVGTRSAVFAPVHDLGLIVVDEEHDGSYKQDESPRYHGRDVAVVRGRQAGALVVLGSATPSMESYHNAQQQRYALIALERRVLDRPMAAVRIVDMRQEFAESGPDVVLSRALEEALADRLARREQAIVLLNRRGYATSIFCRQCAATLECPNCSVSLTVHRAANRARCHYCNYGMTIPKACANCAGPYLEQLGFGTERVEAAILEALPGARVARVDRDTIRRRGAIVNLLSRFAAGDLDVLVGTQMIAKGHDFPRVTLVGVISADVGLGHADFRAAERTFQLLTQVAGRAGRGEITGEAFVQTLYPNHYSIRHACRQDYTAFYQDELHFRQSMQYPPSVALINAVVRARTREGAMADAGQLVTALRWGGHPYRVLGPAQAPLSRLKGEHRAQFFIKGTHRPSMREALQRVLADRPEIRRRTIVDVDPMSVL